ncbi:E3 ubiquitin-protein ligase TRIM33 isoform X2 [Clupea harengus]|uniref:E3 ubiquitin-protein ligase TRIM33 isoform X2 n=1 Tax=Clupea harengus TaxID=7950 RepID=A0A6P8G966_CLUHA|nr:E3 ubiquitin-protein ligase TRIM33 isoform X2 [Clupea harengus]
MSFAGDQKKLDSIGVVPVEHEVSSPLDEQRRCVSLENCCVCDKPLHYSRLPQLFPCLHSACNTCLSKQHVEVNNKKSIECPSCKKSFGITELTENIIFKQSHPLSEKGDVFKCGGCDELSISGWCKDCGEFLCSDCVSAHNRVKLTRSHTIVPQELSTGAHPTLYCPTHREEPLKFFCVTCNWLTCRNCQLVDHRNHSYQMISEAVSASVEKLQSLQGKVTKQKQRVKQSLLDLDQRLRNIIELKTNLKKKLSLVVSKIYRAMLIKAAQVFESAMAVYGREEKILSLRKANLRKMEERQDYIVSFIEKTLSMEGHTGVLLKNRIESQIKDLLFQSVLPAHSMVELNVKVNQTIMTSVENFGGISLKQVPFARKQSNQSESLLESVPDLQNVPRNCIINTSSSPDSLTLMALLGQSPKGPHSHHSQSHNAQGGLPQSMPASSNAPQPQSMPASSNAPQPQSMPASSNAPQSQSMPASSNAPQSQSMPASSNAPQSQSMPASSDGLRSSLASLPQPQPHINGHNLQQHNAALLLPVPTTSFYQHQAQTAMSVFPSPVTCSPSQALCTPFSITEPSVPAQSAPQVQAHSSPSVPAQSAPQVQAHSSPSVPAQSAGKCRPILAQLAPKPAIAHSSSASSQPCHSSSHSSKPHPTASPLNLSIPLTHPKPAQQHSFTNPPQASSASTDSGKAQSLHSPIQSNTRQSPPSALVQQILISQFSKTASNKPLSVQHQSTLNSIADQISLLQQSSSSHNVKQLPSKKWKFHGYQPAPGPKQTYQPTDSGRIASESSPADLPDLQNNSHLSDTQPLTLQGSTSKTQCQEEPSGQRDTQPQLTKKALNVHSNWLCGLPSSFREILGVPPPEEVEDSPQTDLVTTEDLLEMLAGDTDSVTSDEAVSTVEIKNFTLPEKMLSCRVDLVRLDIKLPLAGHPLPQFRVRTDGSHEMISLPGIRNMELLEKLSVNSENPNSPQSVGSKDINLHCEELLEKLSVNSENPNSPKSVGSEEINLHCEVCDMNGGTLMCVTCGRGFHSMCHVPPIVTRLCRFRWKCSICQDLCDSTDPFRKERRLKPCLSSLDQRRCEHLILSLMCKKYSRILYTSKPEYTALSVDFDFIHGRLLRKRSPPYRTPSELVSDVWVLLDSLQSSSEKTGDVLKMLKTFEKRVNQVFGTSLHHSLLTRPTVNREKYPDKTRGQIKRETLKRGNDSSEEGIEPVVKKTHLD